MEYFLIIILFLYNLFLVLSFIPNWDFESQSVNLFSSFSSESQYEYTLYNTNGYVLKKIITKENGKINSTNLLTFSDNGYSITQTVEFENIESIYYKELGVNRLICPRGKFHPYDIESNRYIVPPSFVEEGDWDLSCYKHNTGYFIIFYINNGNYSTYFKKGGNEIERTRALSFYLFAYKLPEYQNLGNQHNYRLPSIREKDGNLLLSGYSLIMNSGVNIINGHEISGHTTLTEMKKNTRAIIDDNFNFYYFTYNNASDFTSGYSNTHLDLGRDYYASSFQVTNNIDNSPLSFEDNVEIINMDFIPNTHYAYYKIYNKDKNITYYGLIDIKENKVLYNIEGDDITFIPDSSGQMIAITQTGLYKMCIIRDNNQCYNIDQCPHIMLDPDGNKCQDECDEGKVE